MEALGSPARTAWLACMLSVFLPAGASRAEPRGKLALESIPGARFEFGGPIGERLERNVDAWLLPASRANPGMLEMFRARDRLPAPQLVPWAGEFAGKYLISLVQALRMTRRPELEAHARSFVAELIATQAEDGYLGPFPARERLLGHWDLWGHYHVMQGLLLWHEHMGDAAAFRTAVKAADLICATYLDGQKRVFDAGSHEMNMAVIHVLGWLYRLTATERYLRLMREIEKDWERAGDYLRQGLLGVDFYRTPLPRWESLHDLQGLVELYRITGEERYRTAFTNLWRSIDALDVHNTGGFSSGEQAVGHPYSPAPIETCCTIAWMAITLDMLRLAGEPAAADALELSTFNGMLGSQHPSGRWWTYNTPMDGVREASAHSIVFQARAGTPELNCCSVNGPRGLGMLSEWAVMADDEGLVVNYLGPMKASVRLPDGTPVTLEVAGSYPFGEGEVTVTVRLAAPATFSLRPRESGWSPFVLKLETEPKREWRDGDKLRLELSLSPRIVVGARQARGKMSIYRGPILLAYEQRLNAFDEDAIPAISPRAIEGGALRVGAVAARTLAPWLVCTVVPESGPGLTLCDFASAGAAGTRYRTWLPSTRVEPRAAVVRPHEGEVVPGGKLLLRAADPLLGDKPARFNFAIHRDGSETPVATATAEGPEAIVDLPAGAAVYRCELRVEGPGWSGWTPGHRFRVDPSLPPRPEPRPPAPGPRADGVLVAAPLARDATPEHGLLEDAAGVQAVEGGIEFDGVKGRVRYAVPFFPARDYAVSLWVEPRSFPHGRIAQVFSAWAGVMDDPLRLTVEKGELFARIEAGMGYSTSGVKLELRKRAHVAAVKAGSTLRLYVDGALRGEAAVPEELYSEARNVALGGNPNFGGNECLEAVISRFALHARALSEEEVRRMASEK